MHFAFAFECVLGKARIQQDVREQIQADGKIAAQHFGIRAEALVAAVGIDAPADGFDFARDVLGAAAVRAFDERLGHQLSDAVVRGGFGEHAALKRGAKFDEGQAMIFFHEQAQAVG